MAHLGYTCEQTWEGAQASACFCAVGQVSEVPEVLAYVADTCQKDPRQVRPTLTGSIGA